MKLRADEVLGGDRQKVGARLFKGESPLTAPSSTTLACSVVRRTNSEAGTAMIGRWFSRVLVELRSV